MPYQRRLAAIMFTDIQGYTRLMQQSEEQAVNTRARHRQIFEPTTHQYGGTIIQYYGDGTLSIFDSCVDAVRCACAMQLAFRKPPVIPVRVGLHVGDIVLDEDDIIGDSVNLASRVESLGIPGSVLISNKVYEEIRNKADLPTRAMGEFHFKNDAAPRKIYALAVPGLVVPEPHQLQGKLEKPAMGRAKIPLLLLGLALSLLAAFGLRSMFAARASIERLAVLPFENRIDDADQAYIVEGLHEELTLKLAEAGVKVLSYTTMKNYEASKKTITSMAKDLNVDALVQGSISRIGDELLVRIQLISGKTDEYLMQPFERQADLSNVVLIYRDVVRSVASAIELAIGTETETWLNQLRPVNGAAYDLFLRGRYHLNLATSQDIRQAIQYFEQSLEVDPGFGQAYSGLVESYLLLGFGVLKSQEAYAQFRIHVQKAIELDPQFANDHHQLAMIKIFSDWDWEGGAEELRLAIRDQPDAWEPYDSYCQLMWAMGRMDESIAAGEKAVSLDPEAHFARCDLAWAYYLDGQYQPAQKQLDVLMDRDSGGCPHHFTLDIYLRLEEAIQGQSGFAEIIADLERRREKFPEDDAHPRSLLGYTYALQGRRDEAQAVASQLEQEGHLIAAQIHMALNDEEKALDLLERAYGQRSFFLMYLIKMAPWLDPLRDHPRFIDLLDRMGLAQ